MLCLHSIIPESVKLTNTASCSETRLTHALSSGTQTHAQSKHNTDSKVCAGDKKDKEKVLERWVWPAWGRERDRKEKTQCAGDSQTETQTEHQHYLQWKCVSENMDLNSFYTAALEQLAGRANYTCWIWGARRASKLKSLRKLARWDGKKYINCWIKLWLKLCSRIICDVISTYLLTAFKSQPSGFCSSNIRQSVSMHSDYVLCVILCERCAISVCENNVRTNTHCVCE